MKKTNLSKYQKLLVALLLLAGFILNIASMQKKATTYDEHLHFSYGTRILNGHPERVTRVDDSKMPVSALNALPLFLSEKLKKQNPEHFLIPFLSNYKTAQYVTVLFFPLLGFFIFLWSRRLYGNAAGTFSLFCFTFSPNLIAHARLVTTDFYVTVMTTISLYFFWRFNKDHRFKYSFLSALTLGLAQLTKYTAIYLYFIFCIILIIKHSGQIAQIRKHYKKILTHFFLFVFINLLVINAGFLFKNTLTPLKDYTFKSRLFQTIQTNSGVLKNIPIPLPHAFMDGLDWVKNNEETGESFGNIYLFGKIKNELTPEKNFKGYYIFAFLFKVPLAIQALLLLAIFQFLRKLKNFQFINNEIFLFIPILFFFIYFNFFFKAQIGIRFILICFPLLHIFIGSLFKNYPVLNIKSKIFFSFLSFYLLASVLSYFPHYIPYFNELVWDRKKAYKILADSNIDWGQGRNYLKEYFKNNSDAIFSPQQIQPGKLVVAVNSLTGIFNPYQYEILRNNFEPDGHIAYAYLVYNISIEDLLKLRTKYDSNY